MGRKFKIGFITMRNTGQSWEQWWYSITREGQDMPGLEPLALCLNGEWREMQTKFFLPHLPMSVMASVSSYLE